MRNHIIRRGFGKAMLATALVAITVNSGHAREDSAPAAALGLADSVRASASGATALYFNPAGMSGIRQYSVEAGYSFLDSLSGHAISVAAIDSATNNAVAMGLAYSYISSAPGGMNRDGHNFRGGLSTGYRGESWGVFVGVGGRYLTLELGNTSLKDIEFFSIDAGLLFEVAEILRLGVVVQNLIDTKAVGEAPRSIGVGAAISFDALQLSFDVDLDLQSRPDEVTTSYKVGLQYMIQNMIVARGGFMIDGLADKKRMGLGLSYVSALIGADLAYSRTLEEPGETIVSAAIKVFLP